MSKQGETIPLNKWIPWGSAQDNDVPHRGRGGNRLTNWNETFWVNVRRTLTIRGQSSIGTGCPEGLGTLEISWLYICRYFLFMSISLGKTLNGLAWPPSWTGLEMAAAVKAFWSPCQPEIFWFLEVLFCPLQFRSHAQTAQRSLHLAALAESVIQSNPLSTSHSLVHWQGPLKGPSKITPVLMLWTEAAHGITSAQHLEIGCTKAGKKDEQGPGAESQALSRQHSSTNSCGGCWPNNCRGWESWAGKRVISLYPSRTWRKGKFRLLRFSQNPLSHPYSML